MASRIKSQRAVALSVGQYSRILSMALAKRLRSSGFEALAVSMRGRPFCLERWIRLGRRRNHADNHSAVSTMVTARAEHVVKHDSSSDDDVQLVPVLRPGMSPRHSVEKVLVTARS
jgi:glycerol-3-phosphate O-acyltransferase